MRHRLAQYLLLYDDIPFSSGQRAADLKPYPHAVWRVDRARVRFQQAVKMESVLDDVVRRRSNTWKSGGDEVSTIGALICQLKLSSRMDFAG
jgi:hypothetical protein